MAPLSTRLDKGAHLSQRLPRAAPHLAVLSARAVATFPLLEAAVHHQQFWNAFITSKITLTALAPPPSFLPTPGNPQTLGGHGLAYSARHACLRSELRPLATDGPSASRFQGLPGSQQLLVLTSCLLLSRRQTWGTPRTEVSRCRDGGPWGSGCWAACAWGVEPALQQAQPASSPGPGACSPQTMLWWPGPDTW